MERLTEDCLLLIFQYLPLADRLAAQQVCTKWRDLSHYAWSDVKKLNADTKTWSSKYTLTFPPYYPELNNEIINQVISLSGKYLRIIDFSWRSEYRVANFKGLFRETVRNICQSCPNVKELYLEYIYTTPEESSHKKEECTDIDHRIVPFLFPICEKLTVFNLKFNAYCDTKEDFARLFRRMKNIRKLQAFEFTCENTFSAVAVTISTQQKNNF